MRITELSTDQLFYVDSESQVIFRFLRAEEDKVFVKQVARSTALGRWMFQERITTMHLDTEVQIVSIEFIKCGESRIEVYRHEHSITLDKVYANLEQFLRDIKNDHPSATRVIVDFNF